jgi:hypothetical protein
MSSKIITLLFLAGVAVSSAACEGDPDTLTGRGARPGAPGENGDENGDGIPESLQCTAKPDGRSYTNFDGAKLEEGRTNENVGVNRARLKPYAVMTGEYTRVLGAAPPSLAEAASSFDDPPARWYAEATHSGVSLNAIFDISFEGCRVYVSGQGDLAAAPTKESAEKFCSSMMRKAWSRTPSPEEISGCATLATDKVAAEPDARRKWSYVCASILSSSHFLTF